MGAEASSSACALIRNRLPSGDGAYRKTLLRSAAAANHAGLKERLGNAMVELVSTRPRRGWDLASERNSWRNLFPVASTDCPLKTRTAELANPAWRALPWLAKRLASRSPNHGIQPGSGFCKSSLAISDWRTQVYSQQWFIGRPARHPKLKGQLSCHLIDLLRVQFCSNGVSSRMP